jgi:hypothetical protein
MLFVLTVLFRTVLLFIHTAGMQLLKKKKNIVLFLKGLTKSFQDLL